MYICVPGSFSVVLSVGRMEHTRRRTLMTGSWRMYYTQTGSMYMTTRLMRRLERQGRHSTIQLHSCTDIDDRILENVLHSNWQHVHDNSTIETLRRQGNNTTGRHSTIQLHSCTDIDDRILENVLHSDQ